MKRVDLEDHGGVISVSETAHVPEQYRPREYGRKEIASLPVRNLIRVSQQRGITNPSLNKIKESIDRGDLINSPDVALLRPEAFEAYIAFINRVWQSDHDMSSFAMDSDGYYHLVVAGHTRIDAVEQIEDERVLTALEAGYDIRDLPEATVWCKIHRDMEPEDILALQMDENLHEKPSQERAAMAMVETYLYGLETGKWAKESEFVKANKGKFSRAAFESARVFCGLDEAIRAFVFSGAIKYGPVVELGKTVRPHREYLAQKFFSKSDQEELTPEEKIKIEEEVIQWNACQIALIQRQNLNITAARQLFAGFCKNWEEALEDLRRNDQEKGQATFDMADPDQEWLAQRKETRKKLRESVTALAQLPASSAFRALQLHVEIMNPDSDEASQMLEVIGSGVRKVDTKLQQVIAGNVGSLALGV